MTTSNDRYFRLGAKLRDKVSGVEGVAVARHEFIAGCVQYTIQPKAKDDGTLPDALNFDAERLEDLDAEIVNVEAKKTGGDVYVPSMRSVPGR